MIILILLSPIIIGFIAGFFYFKIKKSYIHLEYMFHKIDEIKNFIIQSDFQIYLNNSNLIHFKYKNLRIEYYVNEHNQESEQKSSIIIYSLLNDEKLLVLDQIFYGIPKFLIKGPWKNQYKEFSKLFFKYEKNKLENFKKQYYKNYIDEKPDPNKILI